MLEGCTPWPAELVTRYRSEGYWTGELLGDLSRAWCAEGGDQVAVIDERGRRTYRELDDDADRLAASLLDLGLQAPDRVVVQLPNRLEFAVLSLALLRIGVLPIYALPAHRHREIDHFVNLAEAKALFVPDTYRDFDYGQLATTVQKQQESLKHVIVLGEPGPAGIGLQQLIDQAPPVEQARDSVLAQRPRDADDVALFLVSGGTTGLPKLIPRTHNDYWYCVRRSNEICRFDATTVYLTVLPAGHNFPLGHPGVLGTLAVTGKVVFTGRTSGSEVFPVIEREGVTATSLVPAIAVRWLDAPERENHDLSSLALIQVGGSRLLPNVAQRLVAEFSPAVLQEAFGMAEGLINFNRLDDPLDVIVETQGRPVAEADDWRIVDSAGNPVPSGEAGELEVQGPYTLRGYYRAEEHNAKAFTADGFYRTGDVVRWHPSGNFLVEGRVKDVINRGGENISADELEDLILTHPAVANVAVVAMPDEVLGEKVCAYVTVRENATLSLEEVKTHLQNYGVAVFKMPERLELVPSLPFTAVGKIDKRRLREDVAAKLNSGSQ